MEKAYNPKDFESLLGAWDTLCDGYGVINEDAESDLPGMLAAMKYINYYYSKFPNKHITIDKQCLTSYNPNGTIKREGAIRVLRKAKIDARLIKM